MIKLPSDIVNEISIYLPLTDILSLRQTCKKMLDQLVIPVKLLEYYRSDYRCAVQEELRRSPLFKKWVYALPFVEDLNWAILRADNRFLLGI